MKWIWAVLAGALIFFSGGALFASLVQKMNLYAENRERAKGTVSRLKFLGAVLLLALPAWAFFHLSPTFYGKHAAEVTMEIIVVTVVSWILVDSLTEFVIHRVLSARAGVEVPTIILEIMKVALYITALVVILHNYFGINLGPFLATSAILTAIVGLAFQDTLGNVVSGLALHFASPYRIGDWIKTGNFEGKVLAIEWRSTTILTRSNDVVAIPHVTMAKNEIYNFSFPTPRHAYEFKILLDYTYPPYQVVEALTQAAKKTDGVLNEPCPEAYIQSLQDNKATYGVTIWIKDYEHLPAIANRLSTRIWYAMDRAGISFNPGKPHYVIDPPEPDTWEETLLNFFGKLPLFGGMDAVSLKQLIPELKFMRFDDKETIIKEGDQNQDFYILYQGEAAALKNGTPFHTFKPGDFFGEMALISGEPRKATIQAKGGACAVLVTRETLASLLKTHPDFLQQLSTAIEERLKTLPADELPPVVEMKDIKNESSGASILRRIKEFFLTG